MKRLEFLKSYIEHKADGSRIEYLAGNFYQVDEGAATMLCTMGVARDPDAPPVEEEEFVALDPETLADSTGFAV